MKKEEEQRGSHCRVPGGTWDSYLQFQNQKAFVIRLSSHYKDIKRWGILLKDKSVFIEKPVP